MPGDDTTAPVEILLVEDSSGDAELMVEALADSDLEPRVTVVEDGEQAMRYLRRQPPYTVAVRPDLILLDLHLPRKNGLEVLAELEGDDSLRRIPVVVMTSLEADPTVRGPHLPAECCICKPGDLDAFACAVRKIEHFWLHNRGR